MSDGELKRFPGGSVQIGNGDLQDAYEASFSLKRNVKLQHTLRASPAGKTIGNHECTGTIALYVPEEGPERDLIQMAIDGDDVAIRYKAPGQTAVFEGAIDAADLALKAGEATDLKINVIGRLQTV